MSDCLLRSKEPPLLPTRIRERSPHLSGTDLQVSIYLQSAVEDPKYLNDVLLAHKIRDAVVPLQQHPDVALWCSSIPVPNFREL